MRSVTQPIDGSTLTLWKVDPPDRVLFLRTGFQANGDISGHAQVDVFDCGPGQLEITILGKDGSPVTVSTPGVPPQTVSPASRVGVRVVMRTPPAAAGATRCSFSLDTPGLVGTTVVAFVRD